MSDSMEELHRLAEEARGAVERVQASGTGLVPAGGEDNAVEVRRHMATARADLMRREKEIREVAERARQDMEAQMRAALEALEPVKRQVAQMQEGIWTVNLYLGRDEEIETLREGEPAPAGTPIVVRQTVLYMDEESALFAEEGGIDARSMDQFLAWIVAERRNLDQVLPETRGVVAIKPRRSSKTYSETDAYYNALRNSENKVTYFLIRNGENLYVMTTEFDVGERLVPTRDEFLMPLQDRWGKPMEPGSHAWMEAEENAKARERHFMRVAMILQGLVDRTEVFHPLPTPGLNLLAPAAYDAGYVILRADEEKALTTGRQPFREWQRERLALLRPGLRIVGNFGLMRHEEYGRERTSPRNASNPKSNVPHVLDRREDGGFVFLYQRTDKVEKVRRNVPIPDRPGWVYRSQIEMVEPAKRASCWVSTSDEFIIPLDLVTIEECEEYLTARTERREYLTMFPTLKAVIETKQREREEEAPMRALLAQEIVKAHGAEPGDDLDREVLDLVDWWKTSNAWGRSLASDEAKALRMIVKEYKARRDAVTDDVEEKVVAALRLAHRDALVIARRKNGEYVVIEPQPRMHEVFAKKSPYVREHRYSKKAEHVATVEWTVVRLNGLARMRILFEGEGWVTWDKHPQVNRHLTDPEITDLAGLIAAWLDQPIAVVYNPNDGRTFAAYGVGPAPSWDGTLEQPTLHVLKQRSNWARQKDGTVRLTAHFRDGNPPDPSEESAMPRRAWSNDPIREPWEDGHGHDARRVWWDQKAYDRLVKQRETYREFRTQWRALDAMRDGLVGSIEEQVNTKVHTEAYTRFLEDYADPTLWDDFVKRNPVPKVSLGQVFSYRGGVHPLYAVVTDLLGRTHDITGLTVREALALYGKDEIVVETDRTWGDKTIKTVDFPEDLLDYVFSLPETDDDTEDGDDDE